jgi:D-3-phosphoglycerate dehydrogenase
MAFSVLLLDNVDPVCADVFKQRGINADVSPKLQLDELKAKIGSYDAIVVRSATTVDADLLKHADKLQIIGRAGVGVDNIDIPAATGKGVLVMNTPDGNTISTAEHTCGMIIAMARNIPKAVERVKSGGWDRKKFMGTEVHGKKLGIVGLGKIGTEVAVRMKSFGMDIYAYDPFTTQEHANSYGIELVELDELLSLSDFLTVHTPLTEKTRGMISMENSEKLKPGIRLVNCARGGILKEEDLPALIDNGVVAGAALDVYTNEPPTEELYEILKHPQIVSTPHLGASTEEAQEKVAMQIANQIADALENKSYKGSLNSKSISLLTNEEVQPYVTLAEKLGRVSGQIMPKNASDFSFEYTGLCTKYSDVLTDAILKGILSPFIDESVNLINARHYALERGFKLSETNKSEGKNFNDLITIKIGDSDNYKQLSAAVFGPGDYRIVEIDGFGIELQLEGDILMYQNIDKPGMLASVAGTLASHDVNIGALSLGREGKGSNAITAVTLDKQLDSDQIESIHNLDGVTNIKYITLS